MRWTLGVALLMLVCLLGAVTAAHAQVGSLYYKEVSKDGRIYVFNTVERFKSWEASGDMGTAITLVGAGPGGETIVAENETALDLFMFKHDLPGYERPAPKPAAAPPPPTSLKVGDGEVKFGILLQPWYVMDDSPTDSTSTGFYNNYPGNNTFLIRRAELKVYGKVTKNWAFDLMADFAKRQQFTTTGIQTTDDKVLQDLLISYVGLAGHEFGIGQKKVALTDESLRSSADLDFAERARFVRLFSDVRQTGLFYKGEFGKHVGAYASITNGTRSNVPDASNDTLFTAARIDVKPRAGLIVGASGGYGAGETPERLSSTLYGAHVRWDGPETRPLQLRAEYMRTESEQSAAADIEREGYQASALYTFAKKFRLGVRYDALDTDLDKPDTSVETLTVGVAYLIKGKNINLKMEWHDVTEEGRTIDDQLAENYNIGLVAAQISF